MDYLIGDKERHIDIFSRFNFNLLLPVSHLFNFRLNLTTTPSFGYLVNGKFDGMVGALEQKTIDIGCSPVFFREDRSKITSFTARTWIARFDIFYDITLFFRNYKFMIIIYERLSLYILYMKLIYFIYETQKTMLPFSDTK